MNYAPPSDLEVKTGAWACWKRSATFKGANASFVHPVHCVLIRVKTAYAAKKIAERLFAAEAAQIEVDFVGAYALENFRAFGTLVHDADGNLERETLADALARLTRKYPEFSTAIQAVFQQREDDQG